MKTLFYHRKAGATDSIPVLDAKYRIDVWRPRRFEIVPGGLPLLPFAIWTALHGLHVFRNRNYFLLLLYDKNDLVHRSCVFPGFYRFPFMKKYDLQVGYVWTKDTYRGHGLAEFALKKIVRECISPGTDLWYLTYDDNPSSIRVAEKAGFSLVGHGRRTKPCGVSIAGRFVFSNPI